MCLNVFQRLILGFSLALLISLTRASPLPSDRYDVTTPASQSEITLQMTSTESPEETTSPEGLAETTHFPSSRGVLTNDESDDSGDNADEETPDITVLDLRTAGQKVVDYMSYTIAQTNYTFKRLCSQWCSSRNLPDADSRCASIAQAGARVSSVPTLHDILSHTTKTSVFTSLLAVVNVTYQYQHLLYNAASTMQCAGCTGSTGCDGVYDMTVTTLEDSERFTYCNYMNLYHDFQYQSRVLFEMVRRLRTDAPEIKPVPLQHIEDPTEQEEVTMATLATAATQLTEAKTLMLSSVVDQL